MNRLEWILTLAHQGLATGVSMLRIAASKAEKAGDTAKAEKMRELARILDASDSGIADYLENDD